MPASHTQEQNVIHDCEHSAGEVNSVTKHDKNQSTVEENGFPIIPLKFADFSFESPETAMLGGFAALFQTFQLNMSQLSAFPSFDKLWLRLLQVFAQFLEDTSSINVSPNAIKFAYEWLFELIKCMTDTGIFEMKKGLWIITFETIDQFHGLRPEDVDKIKALTKL